MKGLLLKDWYNILRYCRSLLVMSVVFTLVSVFYRDNPIFLVYPCLFSGMIPMTLCSYDEREKWNLYTGALPLTPRDYVSAKYLVGLVALAAVLAVTVGFRAAVAGAVLHQPWTGDLPMVFLLWGVGTLTPTLSLPLIFRFGAEKARIIYLVLVGALCGGSFLLVAQLNGNGEFSALSRTIPPAFPAAFCAAVLGLFAVSWAVSTVIYRQREK